jgi:inner membrane transporter RhtA
MIVAALLLVPGGLAGGGANLFDPRIIAVGLGVALLSSAIPYTLELYALRRLPQHIFGVLMSLEPGLAALAGFLVLDQGLAGREAAGIGLVIAASVGASRSTTAPPPRD